MALCLVQLFVGWDWSKLVLLMFYHDLSHNNHSLLRCWALISSGRGLRGGLSITTSRFPGRQLCSFAWSVSVLDGQTSQSQDATMEDDWRISLLWDLITVSFSLWQAGSCTGSSDGALARSLRSLAANSLLPMKILPCGSTAAGVFFTLPVALNW